MTSNRMDIARLVFWSFGSFWPFLSILAAKPPPVFPPESRLNKLNPVSRPALAEVISPLLVRPQQPSAPSNHSPFAVFALFAANPSPPSAPKSNLRTLNLPGVAPSEVGSSFTLAHGLKLTDKVQVSPDGGVSQPKRAQIKPSRVRIAVHPRMPNKSPLPCGTTKFETIYLPRKRCSFRAAE